jgi:hypothetical protein
MCPSSVALGLDKDGFFGAEVLIETASFSDVNENARIVSVRRVSHAPTSAHEIPSRS